MFRSRRIGFRLMQSLALLALCLRVVVPSGYMAASVADGGWYLQWCPDGVSSQVLEILFEQTPTSGASAHGHQHHQHHLGATSLDGGPGAQEAAPGASYAKCDLSGFSADANIAPPTTLAFLPPTFAATLISSSALVYATRHVRYRPRAPPRPAS